jgi:hypothetical protein
MLYFNIINIHIITFKKLLEKSIHHKFYLIYYLIKTYTYKHLIKVLFTCELHQQLLFVYFMPLAKTKSRRVYS